MPYHPFSLESLFVVREGPDFVYVTLERASFFHQYISFSSLYRVSHFDGGFCCHKTCLKMKGSPSRRGILLLYLCLGYSLTVVIADFHILSSHPTKSHSLRQSIEKISQSAFFSKVRPLAKKLASLFQGLFNPKNFLFYHDSDDSPLVTDLNLTSIPWLVGNHLIWMKCKALDCNKVCLGKGGFIPTPSGPDQLDIMRKLYATKNSTQMLLVAHILGKRWVNLRDNSPIMELPDSLVHYLSPKNSQYTPYNTDGDVYPALAWTLSEQGHNSYLDLGSSNSELDPGWFLNNDATIYDQLCVVPNHITDASGFSKMSFEESFSKLSGSVGDLLSELTIFLDRVKATGFVSEEDSADDLILPPYLEDLSYLVYELEHLTGSVEDALKIRQLISHTSAISHSISEATQLANQHLIRFQNKTCVLGADEWSSCLVDDYDQAWTRVDIVPLPFDDSVLDFDNFVYLNSDPSECLTDKTTYTIRLPKACCNALHSPTQAEHVLEDVCPIYVMNNAANIATVQLPSRILKVSPTYSHIDSCFFSPSGSAEEIFTDCEITLTPQNPSFPTLITNSRSAGRYYDIVEEYSAPQLNFFAQYKFEIIISALGAIIFFILCTGICISSSEMASSLRSRFTTVMCCNCVSYRKAPTLREAPSSVDTVPVPVKYNAMMNLENEETSKAKAKSRLEEFAESARPSIRKKAEQRYPKRGQNGAGEESMELLSPEQRSSAAQITVNKSGASDATAPLPDYAEATRDTRLYPEVPSPSK